MQPVINIALRAMRHANDFVTQAIDRKDLSATDWPASKQRLDNIEKSIYHVVFDALKKAYPKHYIAEPGQISSDNEFSWHLTGLLGGYAISRNLPDAAFALIGRKQGKVESAVIINPVTNEEYTASRGNGATRNSHKIRSNNIGNLRNALIATNILDGLSSSENKRALLDVYESIDSQVLALRGSPCNLLTIAEVAAGKVDGALLNDLSEDEIAPAMLLAKESGALIGEFNGNPASEKSKTLIVASPKLFKQLAQMMNSLHARIA